MPQQSYPGPLALLGDAIASGTADYANIKRAEAQQARARAERLADVQSARDFEVTQRNAAWARETELYNARRFDALKDQLIRDGFLRMEDAANPDAVQAALERGGKDYRAALDELAAYRASIPELIKAGRGNARDLELVLAMGPADIQSARGIMQNAYAAINRVAGEDASENAKNKANGAVLLNAHLGQIAALNAQRSQLEADAERLQSGALTPEEVRNLRAAAIPKLSAAAQNNFKKGAPTPDNQTELVAAMQKEKETFLLIAQGALAQRAKRLEAEMRNLNQRDDLISIAVSRGLAAGMDPEKLMPAQPAASAAATRSLATPDDVNKFLGIGEPKPEPTPPPIAAPPRAPAVPTTFISAGGTMSARTPVSLIGENAGSMNVSAVPTGAFDGVEMRIREQEDRILASQPYSAEASEIRRRRGMAPILDIRRPAPEIKLGMPMALGRP